MDIKSLRHQVNMTQKEFAEYFNIPKRSIENWEGKKRNPPEYVVELIEYKIKKERLVMYSKKEIIYLHDDGEVEVIAEFSGNMSLTVDQALDLCNVDMEKCANDRGWHGYDWNSLDIRFKEE